MRWVAWLLLVAVCVPVAARAESLVLDADYEGSYSVSFPLPPWVTSFEASGENTGAPSGLTSLDLYTDTWCGLLNGPARNSLPDQGWIWMSSPASGGLMARFQGEGEPHGFSGTFSINAGTGAYEGYTGAGSFVVQGVPGDLWPGYTRRATISIRGEATRAAPVPEAGTSTLLVCALPLLALWQGRQRGLSGRETNPVEDRNTWGR